TAGINSLRVYGMAWPIILDTGVGKLPSEGPRSPRSKRPQNVKYCSSGLPESPYRSVSAERMISIDSGVKEPPPPRPVIWDICASTGSEGESRGMIKVTVIPTNIIVKY